MSIKASTTAVDASGFGLTLLLSRIAKLLFAVAVRRVVVGLLWSILLVDSAVSRSQELAGICNAASFVEMLK